MKILQVSMGLSFGGIENIELNIARNINSNFTCDFLTPSDGVFNLYKKEINKLGGNIYNLNCKRKNIFSKIKYYIKLNKFLKKNKYDVVHINSSVFLFSYQVLKLSKKYGYRVISHIHSAPKISKFKRIIINMLMPKYIKKADMILACSCKARDNLFETKYFDKIKILENVIDINKYKFNKTKRNEIRTKYNLNNKKVYAYIGRYDLDKNVSYVIDLFNKISNIDKNSHLLLIGDLDELKTKVNNLNISDKVTFLGFIDNVNEVLNGIDICIYPSIREGFGLSILEALTNGVIVYGSNNIIDEFNSYSNYRSFNLNDNIDDITKDILSNNIKIKRKDVYKNMSKYDIKKYSSILESIYRGDRYED